VVVVRKLAAAQLNLKRKYNMTSHNNKKKTIIIIIIS